MQTNGGPALLVSRMELHQGLSHRAALLSIVVALVLFFPVITTTSTQCNILPWTRVADSNGLSVDELEAVDSEEFLNSNVIRYDRVILASMDNKAVPEKITCSTALP